MSKSKQAPPVPRSFSVILTEQFGKLELEPRVEEAWGQGAGDIWRDGYRAGMLRAAEIVNEWCECGADGCIPDSIANAIREEAEKE